MAEAAAPDPMAAIRRFVEGFNADDADAMQSACLDDIPVIDDFPPHFWSGPSTASRWYGEMAAMASAYGMAGWSVTPGEATMFDVSGPTAYVVVPVDCRWQQKGTEVARSGYFTASLSDGPDGWRISAFTWTWT